MADRRTREVFAADVHAVLSIDIDVHSKRAFVYKAVQDYSALIERNGECPEQLWSTGVVAQCKADGCRDSTKFMREHPYPIGQILAQLAPEEGRSIGPTPEEVDELFRNRQDLLGD